MERLAAGPGHLRRGLPVRVRAARLPAGGRLRARDRARAPRAGGRAAPRVRPRRLRRRRGVHLLRPPREDADHRQGGPDRAAQPRARSRSLGTVAAETGTLAAGDLCNTNAFYPDDETRRDRRARCSRSRSAGSSTPAWTSSIAETFSWGEEALLALEVIKAGRADRGGHPVDPPRAGGPRGLDPRGHLRAAGAGRRRRRRPELHPRPADDAAAAGADPRGGRLPRGRACRSRTAPPSAEPSFQSLTDPGCDCLPGGRPFPTALEPLSVQPLRDRRVRPRGLRPWDVRYLGVCCGAGAAP